MAWVAVDLSGEESIFEYEPERKKTAFWPTEGDFMCIPSGSIEKLIGRKLTWSDEPVELMEE